jgi:hypothetical protein
LVAQILAELFRADFESMLIGKESHCAAEAIHFGATFRQERDCHVIGYGEGQGNVSNGSEEVCCVTGF